MYKTLLFISFVAMTLAASRVPDQGLGVFEGDKILVELYYETQCPYCTQYITGQLNDVITVQVCFYLCRESSTLLTSNCIHLEMERSLRMVEIIPLHANMDKQNVKETWSLVVH